MITMPTLTRDDDISVYTCPYTFKELHKKFIEKETVHTVAVIMKDLWLNQALFYYLATAPYLEIGLHGWEHKDYSELSYEECYADLKKSLDYWKENSIRMTGQAKEIKIFFAPWNRESDNIKNACYALGLDFCNVRKGKWNGYQVRSLHWWSADNYKV
jgi:peptidoglycan/xylan/chitin deacetylase (PgdA/CDA1 family)